MDLIFDDAHDETATLLELLKVGIIEGLGDKFFFEVFQALKRKLEALKFARRDPPVHSVDFILEDLHSFLDTIRCDNARDAFTASIFEGLNDRILEFLHVVDQKMRASAIRGNPLDHVLVTLATDAESVQRHHLVLGSRSLDDIVSVLHLSVGEQEDSGN